MPEILTKPHQLAKNVYILSAELPHRLGSNVILLDGEQRVLVDCGPRERTRIIQRNLRQLELDYPDISHIFITHPHRDHADGLGQILKRNPHIVFHVGEKDRYTLQEGDYELTAGFLYGRKTGKTPVGEENILKGGEEFIVGDRRIRVHDTSGHSPGSMSFEFEDIIEENGQPEKKTFLAVGDAVFGANLPRAGSDVMVWKRSLDRMRELPFDFFLNGHNPIRDLPMPKSELEAAIDDNYRCIYDDCTLPPRKITLYKRAA